MKLLIVTQVVDVAHPVLGFFHQWIAEFATHCDEVTVITLQEGTHTLPDNVRVYSLGKIENQRVSLIDRIRFVARFKYLIWKHRPEYDAVFVHMNPEYIVIGGLLWRVLGKRIGLWYVHRSRTWKLRVAVCLVHDIFSTTAHAMRVATPRLHLVGHGIDLSLWKLSPPPDSPHPRSLLYVGRITAIKRIEYMIDMTLLLRARGVPAILTLVGAPGEDDAQYHKSLIDRIPKEHQSAFVWAGAVPQSQLPRYYVNAHALLNFSPTGGMDKTVLEGMACGVPPVLANKAFEALLGEHAKHLIVEHEDVALFAEAALRACEYAHDTHIRQDLRERIAQHASLPVLIGRIVHHLSSS